MLRSIWDDVRHQFNFGNMLTRIVIVNVAIFIFVNLVRLVLVIAAGGIEDSGAYYRTFLEFFMISSDWFHNLTHPWVIITHMFLHESFWHILWNMLIMWWFGGRIVGDLLGDKRVLPLYLLGGLMGAIVYFIVGNMTDIWGTGAFALGASAAVMAILLAAASKAPDYPVHLIILGEVKLKYIVGAFVLVDIIGISQNYNSGGSFAHLGGAMMGWFFVAQLDQGNDLSIPVNNLLEKVNSFFKGLFSNKPQSKLKVDYKNPSFKKRKVKTGAGHHDSDSGNIPHQEQLDAILDKIKESGYESLDRAEKEFLFNASKK